MICLIKTASELGGSRGGLPLSGRLGSCNALLNLSTTKYTKITKDITILFHSVSFVLFVVIFANPLSL